MIITEFLDLSALLVPDRTAIAFEGKRYSYAQLKERVNRLADSLNRLGLAKGDRAAIIEVNNRGAALRTPEDNQRNEPRLFSDHFLAVTNHHRKLDDPVECASDCPGFAPEPFQADWNG